MNQTQVGIVLQEINDDIRSGNIEKAVIDRLLNLVESLASENAKLTEIIQQQNDEINRLKGEQGRHNSLKKKMDIYHLKKSVKKLRVENLKVKMNHETANQRNQKSK